MFLIRPSYMVLGNPIYQTMLDIVCDASACCYRAIPPDKLEEQEAKIQARIKAGHESVIEHVGFSVMLRVDRGITHELCRHRTGIALSMESSRYCNYTNGKFGNEITFVMPPEVSVIVPEGRYLEVVPLVSADETAIFIADEDGKLTTNVGSNKAVAEWAMGLLQAERSYRNAVTMGMEPEIARGLLPNATAAYITITANMREWRHIFKLRALGTTGRPHPQMVEIMSQVLGEAKLRFPAFFADLV